MSDEQLYIHLSWSDPASGDIFTQGAPLPVTLGRSHRSDIVLNSSVVSREHARLEADAETLYIVDLNSENGVLVNGRRVLGAQLKVDDVFQIGPFLFDFRLEMRPQVITSDPATAVPETDGTIPLDHRTLKEVLEAETTPTASLDRDKLLKLAEEAERVRQTSEANLTADAPKPIPFPPSSFMKAKQVSPAALETLGFDVDETVYLALGGGLGSFAWIDYLLICGVDPADVVAVGVEPEPHGRYRRLCCNSQLPDHERLRSDSGATIDNVWGWPGYALREMWHACRHGRIGHAACVGWQIFCAPTFAESYTPRAGDVYDSLEREMARIGWDAIWRYGRIRAIRQTDDGRYAVAYSQTNQAGDRRHCFLLAPYVHLALGYPGVRFLPDLQAYRVTTGDFRTVINAYEEHEYVYAQLAEKGGVVVLRGRSIVASRILQRLHQVRADNPNIYVVHLMRAPNTQGARYGRTQRRTENHWELQPFKWPKASFTGDLRFRLEEANEAGRDRLLNDLGGTTTADRRAWRDIVSTGLAEGWYQIRFGQVEEVSRNAAGKLIIIMREREEDHPLVRIKADFIVDATGLNARIEQHPLLKDLLDHYELPRNTKGNLAVANDFEVTALRNGEGCLYASGAMTLGGPFAPVDSFMGLQFAAQRSVNALADLEAPGVHRLNAWRSFRQWLRWASRKAP